MSRWKPISRESAEKDIAHMEGQLIEVRKQLKEARIKFRTVKGQLDDKRRSFAQTYGVVLQAATPVQHVDPPTTPEPEGVHEHRYDDAHAV